MSINLAVFASGSGTTLQAIIDSIETGKLDAKITIVVSNNPGAYALERARKANISTYVITSKGIENIDSELSEVLKDYEIDLIVLAGYLRKIGDKLLEKYRIINTHPSLLPKFGGKGMHGMHVHQAVIDAKESESGVTVHFVNGEYDSGSIIRQTTVPVLETDDAESLSAKVQKAENSINRSFKQFFKRSNLKGMFSKIKEECGIFGIYAMENEEELAPTIGIGLSCLQHRGEESCGIAINDGGLVTCEKDLGLVSDVFTPDRLAKLPTGKIGIGHVRYSTTGAPKRENAQPIVKRYAKGNICVVHNGNLTNTEELRNELEEHGAIFNSTSDTEVICSIIARERVKTGSIEEAVKNATKYLKGAYSLLVMSSRKLVAVRDPYGFRPLCMGRMGDDYVFASESCALDVAGATFERDIKPRRNCYII